MDMIFTRPIKIAVFFTTIILLLLTSRDARCQSLVTYPAPAADFEKQSDLYAVVVKAGNKALGSYVYVSRASVDSARWEWQGQEGKSFHFTTFSFTGTVTIEVTKLHSAAAAATIRPDRIGLGTVPAKAVPAGKKVVFTISRPGKIAVEFDDDPAYMQPLMIFADPPEHEADVPDTSATAVFVVTPKDSIVVPRNVNTVYFAPGVYNTGLWRVPANVNQVYISGGAYVSGYIMADRTSTAALKINGRGILSNDRWPFHYPEIGSPRNPVSAGWYKSIVINGGKGHLVEGITMIDGSAFNILLACDSAMVRNVNIHGFRFNNDGITAAGRNIYIRNCFISVGDDGIVLNGSGNFEIKDCVFWHLRGGSIIQLGWRPHNMNGHNLVTDCDILHAAWKLPQTQNSGFINYMGDIGDKPEARITGFTVRNIYFDTEVMKIIDIRMNRGRNHPLAVSNFLFENIYAKIPAGLPGYAVFLNGADSTHTIDSFRFVNFHINGIPINNTNYRDDGYFKVGNFVRALSFSQ